MSEVSTGRTEIQRLTERFGDAIISSKEERGDLFVCVKRESIVEVLEFLKNDPELDYGYFSECLGVDYSQWTHPRDLEERFEIVYNLMSLKLDQRLFIKIGVNDGQTVPTAKGIYLGAEYPEREIADLYGVVFEGNVHSDRFLLPDDWIGYPLRKEYPLGGDDVIFAQGDRGPAVEDISMPHAGESFEGKTGTDDVGGR